MRASISFATISIGLISGCASDGSVRYVYQDKDFGVVGMPENTNRWPTHYRRRAEKLMDKQFPDGHEIVRAEEVDAGSRTLKVEGSKTAEISPQAPADFLSVAKFGRTASRSQSDITKIKECRIVYRRLGSAEPRGYSADVALNPTRYLDPNDLARKKLEAGIGDDEVKKSGGDQARRAAKPEKSDEG